MAVIIPSIIALGVAGYQAYQGYQSKKEAEEAAKKNVRPTYTPVTPKRDYDMLNLLESRAGQGLSDSSRMYLQTGADRGLSSTLDAIIKSGGSVNDASRAQQTYSDSLSRMALLDDQAKLRNLQNLIAQQRQVGNRENDVYDAMFQVNEYAPFMDEQQRIAQLRTLGQQQTNQAISTAGSAVANYGNYLAGAQATNRESGLGTNLLGQPVDRAAGGNNRVTAADLGYSFNSPSLNPYNFNTSGYPESSRYEIDMLLNNQNPYGSYV